MGEVLDYVRYSKKACMVERHGKPVAAIVDFESYQQLTLFKQYQEWTRRAVRQISERYHPEKIILFGSAASETMQEGSDIDLLIVKKSDRKRSDRVDEVLELVDADIPVELHLYTPKELDNRLQLGDFFIQDILKSGRVLYEQKK